MKSVYKYLIVSVLVTIMAITMFGFYSLQKYHDSEENNENVRLEMCIRTFWQLLSFYGDDYRIVDGRLQVGSYVANGNFELPDRIQEIFGGVATIFMGDERVSTNVLNSDGKRALGTRLEGAAYETVFKQGKSYRGRAPILGVSYLTAYDPITDKNGKVIGALFVGVKESDFVDRLHVMKRQLNVTLVTTVAVLAFILILMGFFMKQVEDEKDNQVRFLQTLIDTIPNPIFHKDSECRYTGCNKAFEEAVGFSMAEIIGKTPHELWPNELAEKYRQQDLEMLANPGTQSYETKVMEADGTTHDVIFNKATFEGKAGVVAGLVGVILDITEYKRAEEEKHRLESQLDHARLMETVVMRLGHDLKTPLTPLFILLPVIKNRLADPDLIKKVEMCIKSAATINNLVDKTRRLARISTSIKQQELENVPLAGVVDQACSDCAELIAKKQIDCQNLVDPAILVNCVPAQLRELFLNLIANSVQFSGEGGIVAISAERCDETLTLSVSDEGVGIAPEHLEHVFDEFYKADESRHDLEASGLGLSICKRVVRNHHGRIWAESDGIGKGTKIRIAFNEQRIDCIE